MNSFLITCFLIIISILTEGSGDCPQCFDSMRVQMSSNRRVFRLKNSSLPVIPRGHSFRNSDHLLDDHVIEEVQELTTESHPTVNNYRIRPVSVPNMNRHQRRLRNERRMRNGGRTSSTTTTTTTTTTQPSVDDYYEYEDDYDDYSDVDYHITTTTSTTTEAPRRREPPRRRGRGRRRFRRPLPTEPPTTTTTTTLSPNYKQRPDGRVIDYIADPNFPYELKGADLTEYPFFIRIPENDFSCKGRVDGYYANIDLRCQVYHHCATGHQRYDFLCPNFTLFDQTSFTCRFINTVDCDSSEKHYSRNNELYLTTTIASIVTNNATK